jgi:beta-N-acetylhexosaminidase
MKSLGPLIIDVQGTILTEEDKQLLSHSLVGGVILFTRNFESISQLIALVQQIKQLRTPALMITVDHEGGRIQRFRQGFHALPSLGSIGQCYEQDPKEARQLAHQAGWLMASELKAVGIDVSYAPVLDIDRQLNTVIGDRSFHQQPAIITDLARAYIDGMNRAGMLAIGKHFPGHGGVSADSHIDIPVDSRSMSSIEAEDLQPFAQLIHESRLAGIMPAHVCYPALDPMPTTFSSHWLVTVLRQQLGFQGLVISDDLGMAGASMVGDYPTRLRLALASGCDMALLCNQRAEVKTVLAACEELALDLTDSIAPFTKPALVTSLAQLQQQTQWQAATQAMQEFFEKSVMS